MCCGGGICRCSAHLGNFVRRWDSRPYVPRIPTINRREAIAQLTGKQWVDSYLHPLSRTDLLADHIISGAKVHSIARRHCLKTQQNIDRTREEEEFRILLQHRDGRESIDSADLVIDTTGVYGQPNWCGTDGLPARGEQQLRARIEYNVPDCLGTERAKYAACHVLVVGNGISAATTVVSLATILDQEPQIECNLDHSCRCRPRVGGPG